MSKKALRAQLAAKQQEIDRLKASLVKASQSAAQSQLRLQGASREDHLAVRGPLADQAARDQESVERLGELLGRAREEAARIKARLLEI